mmetsp:Transcript_10036/g.31696  ORF Transcript_10036/g.31696 Transcript_10036/m.31696 type:complete len:252 (+) Transcript_10036:434-1189(+)
MSIARIALLPASATKARDSSAESAMPVGCEKRAAEPSPSSGPSCGGCSYSPATVVVRRSSKVTILIASLPESATSTNASVAARPLGKAKAEFVPKPSAMSSSPEPASVVTDGAPPPSPSVSSRNRLLPVSATTSLAGLEPGMRARPRGLRKVAAVPVPSSAPISPVPASVLTSPVAMSTERTECPSSSATYSVAPSSDTAVCAGRRSGLPESASVVTRVRHPSDMYGTPAWQKRGKPHCLLQQPHMQKLRA